MCVIAFKPANKSFNNKDLTNMWHHNQDGAGIAYYDNNKLVVKKGMMRLKEVKQELAKLHNKDVVLHFRYATHGKVNPHQTHPFVIHERIRKSKYIAPQAPKAILFHNGTIENFGNEKISDTIEFTTKILSRLDPADLKIDILKLIHSKFALMQDGKIHLIGHYSEKKGIKFSNLHWSPITKHYKPRKNTGSSFIHSQPLQDPSVSNGYFYGDYTDDYNNDEYEDDLEYSAAYEDMQFDDYGNCYINGILISKELEDELLSMTDEEYIQFKLGQEYEN